MMNYIRLLRVQQWYKNVVVFLALFFSGNLFNLPMLYTISIAFISLCLVSSAGYIINDLVDKKQDQLHPERKLRPLAAGKISTFTAIMLEVILLMSGLILAGKLGKQFFYAALLLFGLTQVYTFVLKKIIIADVLTIATLFVVRSIAGALPIQVVISPWLVLVPFFLSLFLSIGKRHGELLLFKDKAGASRQVLQEYSLPFTNSVMIISTSLVIISYALYSFLSPYNKLLYTLPFALFVIFRYYYLICSGSTIARNPEQVIKDSPMIIGIIIWVIVTTMLVYG